MAVRPCSLSSSRSLYIYVPLLVFCTASLFVSTITSHYPPLLAINLSKYTIIFIVRPPSAVYPPSLIVFPSRSRSPLHHRAIPLVHPSTPFLFYFFFGVLAFFFSFGVCVWSGLCDNTLRLSSFLHLLHSQTPGSRRFFFPFPSV